MEKIIFKTATTAILLTLPLATVSLGKGAKNGQCVRTILSNGKEIKKEVFPSTTETDCKKKAKAFLYSITNNDKKACIYHRKIVDTVQWQIVGSVGKKLYCKYSKIAKNPYGLALTKKEKKRIAMLILNTKYQHARDRLRSILAANKGKTPQYIKKKYGIKINHLKILVRQFKKNGIKALLKKSSKKKK